MRAAKKTLMPFWLPVVVAVLLTGCATQGTRVSCEGKLLPINAAENSRVAQSHATTAATAVPPAIRATDSTLEQRELP